MVQALDCLELARVHIERGRLDTIGKDGPNQFQLALFRILEAIKHMDDLHRPQAMEKINIITLKRSRKSVDGTS